MNNLKFLLKLIVLAMNLIVTFTTIFATIVITNIISVIDDEMMLMAKAVATITATACGISGKVKFYTNVDKTLCTFQINS